MDKRITLHERVQAVDRLMAMAFEANQIASWLADCDLETESDKTELAAIHLLAAVALLERPIRPQLPPGRWQQSQLDYLRFRPYVTLRHCPDLRKCGIDGASGVFN